MHGNCRDCIRCVMARDSLPYLIVTKECNGGLLTSALENTELRNTEYVGI